MANIYPSAVRLRDAWDQAMDDGVIDDDEEPMLQQLIYETADGTTLAIKALRVVDGRHTNEAREDFERLHGPIDLQAHKNARIADDDPSAA